VTCSVICRASIASAMRPAYGAEEMGIGGQPVTIVVDVANVMGSRPDGWWRDRAGAAVRLHADIARLAASGRAILPDEPGETGTERAGAPGFLMVLEGAAKAAAARLAQAEPDARAEPAARAEADAPDGRAAPDGGLRPVRPGEVRVVQAAGSGDDAIVAVVRELPGRRVVVTADRGLRERCVAVGAEIRGPGWLLGLLRG
jgi:8-oxo-dGTP diphosphatase